MTKTDRYSNIINQKKYIYHNLFKQTKKRKNRKGKTKQLITHSFTHCCLVLKKSPYLPNLLSLSYVFIYIMALAAHHPLPHHNSSVETTVSIIRWEDLSLPSPPTAAATRLRSVSTPSHLRLRYHNYLRSSFFPTISDSWFLLILLNMFPSFFMVIDS